MSRMRLLAWVCLLLVTYSACPAPAATLVRDGKPLAVVALPPSPDDAEKLAARELIDHVEKMSGARLEIVTVDGKDLESYLEQARRDGKVPIFLGRSALPKLEKAIQAKSKVEGTFVLR